ncbi:twin-arginine translocation pathway signal protein, partial [Paracraurococcus ruber]|uniref:nitroreductase family protein n=1 Tax=Paracraurococcus ruber TaxID=77675 RepID=UPI001864BCB1
ARPVGAASLAAIAAVLPAEAGFAATAAAGPVAALRALTWEAWLTEAQTPAAHLETVNLMRLGRAAVAAQPDGVSVWGPGLDPLVERGVLTREGFATPGHPAYQEMLERYRPMLAATPAYVWTASAADTRGAAFEAGRAWLRLNLAATGLGLALQPVSQALQEYPEMDGHRAALHRLLGVAAPGRVQMLGRIGYLPGGQPGAQAVAPTPRWPVESRIMPG